MYIYTVLYYVYIYSGTSTTKIEAIMSYEQTANAQCHLQAKNASGWMYTQSAPMINDAQAWVCR